MAADRLRLPTPGSAHPIRNRTAPRSHPAGQTAVAILAMSAEEASGLRHSAALLRATIDTLELDPR